MSGLPWVRQSIGKVEREIRIRPRKFRKTGPVSGPNNLIKITDSKKVIYEPVPFSA